MGSLTTFHHKFTFESEGERICENRSNLAKLSTVSCFLTHRVYCNIPDRLCSAFRVQSQSNRIV